MFPSSGRYPFSGDEFLAATAFCALGWLMSESRAAADQSGRFPVYFASLGPRRALGLGELCRCGTWRSRSRSLLLAPRLEARLVGGASARSRCWNPAPYRQLRRRESDPRPRRLLAACDRFLDTHLAPLSRRAGTEIEGRVAESPNAFDDIVAELDRREYSEIILETIPAHVSHSAARRPLAAPREPRLPADDDPGNTLIRHNGRRRQPLLRGFGKPRGRVPSARSRSRSAPRRRLPDSCGHRAFISGAAVAGEALAGAFAVGRIRAPPFGEILRER